MTSAYASRLLRVKNAHKQAFVTTRAIAFDNDESRKSSE